MKDYNILIDIRINCDTIIKPKSFDIWFISSNPIIHNNPSAFNISTTLHDGVTHANIVHICINFINNLKQKPHIFGGVSHANTSIQYASSSVKLV